MARVLKTNARIYIEDYNIHIVGEVLWAGDQVILDWRAQPVEYRTRRTRKEVDYVVQIGNGFCHQKKGLLVTDHTNLREYVGQI